MASQSPAALKLNILAFVGSVREGRMAERMVSYLKTFFAEHKDGHTFEVIGTYDKIFAICCLEIL